MPQFNRTGTIQRGAGVAVDQLDRDFDTMDVIAEELSGLELAGLFEVISAESAAFKMGKVTTALPLPTKNLDTEGIPYTESAPGFSKEVDLYQYRQGTRITDTLLQTERYGLAKSMVQGLVRGPQWKKEFQRAGIFNNGFASELGADGQALFANAHPHENIDRGTWDNLETGTFDYDTYHAMRLLLRTMTNSQGYPDIVMPTTLLVPPALEKVAKEITEADREPDSALNKKAVLNKFSIVVSNFLSSSTAAYLIGDKMGDERGIFEAEAISLNTKDTKPSDNPDIVWAKRTKFMNAMFAYSGKNIVATAG